MTENVHLDNYYDLYINKVKFSDLINVLYYFKFTYGWPVLHLVITNNTSFFGKVDMDTHIMYLSYLAFYKSLDEINKTIYHEVEHMNQSCELWENVSTEQLEQYAKDNESKKYSVKLQIRKEKFSSE